MRIHSILFYLSLFALFYLPFLQTGLAQQTANSYCGTRGFGPELLPKHPCQRHQHARQGQDKIFLIKFYIIRDDNGNGGRNSDSRIRRALAETNLHFAGSGIQFALCGSPVYVDSSLLRFNYQEFSKWAYQVADPRYFNIFETLASPGFPFPVAAFASFPGDANRIVTFGSLTGRILTHELGHNLGLLHTFGQNYPITDEWVNGGNCQTAGDRVCDTPADPYRLGINDSCGYADTVLKDINGDIYMPNTYNIMSYYPCQTDHLTQGQFNRMNGIYEQERFYVHNLDSSQFARLEGVPELLCVGDSIRTKLIGYPAGGTFSGPGVQGDSLIATGLAGGAYSVTYHLPAAIPVAPYTKTDAVQPVYLYRQPYHSDSLWLSFEAGENAPLEAIRVRLRADTTILLNWQLHSGQGLGGSVLYSQVDTIYADSVARWYRFPLRQQLNQQVGQLYTLAFSTVDSFYWDVTGTFSSYPQEVSSLTDPQNPWNNQNPCFATEITSTQMVCANDSITYEFSVVEPLPSYWAPEDRFCIEQDAVQLSSYFQFDVSSFLSDITFQVNGQFDSLIRPSQVGSGDHEIQLSYEDLWGCKAIQLDTISIYDSASVVVPSTFCESDPNFDLSQLWPDGSYWLNSVTADSIQPSVLGPGPHLLEMHLPNVYDSLRLINQEIPLPGGLVQSINVMKDSAFWQAFRPDTSAHFGLMEFFMILNDSARFARFIYRGLPDSSQILWSDTTWLYRNFSGWEASVATPQMFSLALEKDSLYSVRIVRLDSVGRFSAPGRASIVYDSTQVFDRGTSNLANQWGTAANLFFKLSVDFELGCGEDKQQIIEVFSLPQPPANWFATPDTVVQGSISQLAWDTSWTDSLRLQFTGANCLNCAQLTDSISIRWDSLGWAKIVLKSYNELGCDGDSVIRWVWVKADQPSAIEGLLGSQIYISPNPFSSHIHLQFHLQKRERLRFCLFDMYGKKIWEREEQLFEPTNHEISVDIPPLSPAMYLFEMQVGDKRKVWKMKHL